MSDGLFGLAIAHRVAFTVLGGWVAGGAPVAGA